MTNETTSYAFSWHDLDQYGDDEERFLRWMVVNLVVGRDATSDGDAGFARDLLDRVSAASDGFKNVELTVQLNGIEVNARYFVQQVQANMELHTRREAENLLDSCARATELLELTRTIQRALRDRAHEVAAKVGVRLRDDDDDDDEENL